MARKSKETSEMTTPRKNSKKKGNKWEREVCKGFKEWSGYEFSRTPASGGLRWKKADNITSDITCTDEKHARKCVWSIECKFYNEIKFEHVLLDTKGCEIWKFWNQAQEDAKRAKKIPLLVMRYNNMPKGDAFVMMDNETAKLILEDHQDPKAILGRALKKPILAIRVDANHIFYVVMFKDLQNIPYKEFHKRARELKKQRYPKEK